MKTLKQALALAALLAASTAPAVADVSYDFSFNTAAWAGTAGYLDLQFLPLDSAAPGAQATLSAFTTDGLLLAGALADGGVSGALPGTLTLSNSSTFNAWLQPLNYGTSIAFHLTLSGPWETALAGSATTFSATLLNDAWDTLAPSASIDLFPGGTTVVDAGGATVTAAPVPLPAAWSVMMIGLTVLGGALRKRRQE